MNAYQYLAQAYDKLMSDVDYDAWAIYISSLLGQTDLRIFEVSCGTGSISCRLYDMGYYIVASDISPEMLEIAMTDARRHGRNIVFIQQDMRSIKTGSLFDAVVSACDGPNYLDPTGLSEFFTSAHRILKPGGQLLFDISSPYKLKSMDGEVFYDDSDDATCIWNNHYDINAHTLTMDVMLFIRQGDIFQKFTEQHVQFAHEINDIQNALTASGFGLVEAYQAFTKNAVRSDSDRIQFVCRKD